MEIFFIFKLVSKGVGFNKIKRGGFNFSIKLKF